MNYEYGDEYYDEETPHAGNKQYPGGPAVQVAGPQAMKAYNHAAHQQQDDQEYEYYDEEEGSR